MTLNHGVQFLSFATMVSVLCSCSLSKSSVIVSQSGEIETLKNQNGRLEREIQKLESDIRLLEAQIINNQMAHSEPVELSKAVDNEVQFSQLQDLDELHSSSSKYKSFKKGGVEKTLDLSSTQKENFVASAMTFLGTPHVMGGTSRSGIDCSGLLHQSFVLNGIDGIPRTAQEFARYGIIIADINDLKRGDLVFFTGTYNSSRFVTHAGICIGQGEFVHASSTRGVMISKLNDPNYWKSKFAFGTALFP